MSKAPAPLPPGVLLPNDLERQQIFYWLQRISSYTAWNRILSFYQAWAEEMERNVVYSEDNPHPINGPALQTSELILVLKRLAQCEEGTKTLLRGDKRVFKYNIHGRFSEAERSLDAWLWKIRKYKEGEIDLGAATLPRWPELRSKILDLAEAWGECSEILETSRPDSPSQTLFNVYMQDLLAKMTFPAVFPDIPKPEKEILVATGGFIPCSGIWEPVEVIRMPIFFGLLSKAGPPPSGEFKITGCLSYLHGGSPAPNAYLNTIDDSLQLPTTWRLLWRDNRYEDGSIPAEEADYVFLQPQPGPRAPPPPPYYSPPEFITGYSGKKVMRAGRWGLQDQLDVIITLNVGESLPQHAGADVDWVWLDK